MRQLFICLMLMVSITAHANDANRAKQAGFSTQIGERVPKNRAELNENRQEGTD